eukprot:139258_1
MQNTSIKEGYLIKKSLHLSQKRKRWIVLTNDKIYSFKNKNINAQNRQKSQNPTEIFDLNLYCNVSKYKSEGFCLFQNKNKKQRVFLTTSKEQIYIDEWIECIQIAIKIQKGITGSLVFQKKHYTRKQMQHIYDKTVDFKKAGKMLFGDNDEDKCRKRSKNRKHFAGQASVMGKYDLTLAYGITTTFYKTKKNYKQFQKTINKQFKSLKQHLVNGYDVIIPHPCKTDKYYQLFEHNIGTGIANLDTNYLRYIDNKIGELKQYASSIKYVDYYNYNYQPIERVGYAQKKYIDQCDVHIYEKKIERKHKRLTAPKVNKCLKLKRNEDRNNMKLEMMFQTCIKIIIVLLIGLLLFVIYYYKYNLIAVVIEIIQMLLTAGWNVCEYIQSIIYVMCNFVYMVAYNILQTLHYIYYYIYTCKYRICESIWWSVMMSTPFIGGIIFIDLKQSLWEWQENDKIWKPYKEKMCRKIETLNTNESYQFIENNNHQTYKITKLSHNSATQINISTYVIRNVKRNSNKLFKINFSTKYIVLIVFTIIVTLFDFIIICNYLNDLRLYLVLYTAAKYTLITFYHYIHLITENICYYVMNYTYSFMVLSVVFVILFCFIFKSTNNYNHVLIKLFHPDISTLFYKTVDKNKWKIIKIENVENNYLWNRFCNAKKKMDSRSNEKHLFHGTRGGQHTMNKIINEGFKSNFTKVAYYGEGSYLARDASYSIGYSHNINGVYKMFMCKVICGKSCLGKSSIKLHNWPVCDSLVDNMYNPSIYVIREDERIYPMCVIHFKKLC